jgi:hypothetical protein
MTVMKDFGVSGEPTSGMTSIDESNLKRLKPQISLINTN